MAMIERPGARSMVIEGGEMPQSAFVRNDRSRCYGCKHGLFKSLKAIAGREGLKVVIEGSNSDDTSDYRPGLAAARELGICSSLMEAGLTKDGCFRANWSARTRDKPALACLFLPYSVWEPPSRRWC